jgi:hypothetical protein
MRRRARSPESLAAPKRKIPPARPRETEPRRPADNGPRGATLFHCSRFGCGTKLSAPNPGRARTPPQSRSCFAHRRTVCQNRHEDVIDLCKSLCWSGGTGRRSRLKICRRSPGVGVQLPPPAPLSSTMNVEPGMMNYQPRRSSDAFRALRGRRTKPAGGAN